MNKDELDTPQIKKPKIPKTWNYDKSVKKIKQFVYKWRNLTESITKELWIAREVLSAQGKRTDLVTKVTKCHTWTGYCKDIGSSRQVVDRWLRQIYSKRSDLKPRACAAFLQRLEERQKERQQGNVLKIAADNRRALRLGFAYWIRTLTIDEVNMFARELNRFSTGRWWEENVVKYLRNEVHKAIIKERNKVHSEKSK